MAALVFPAFPILPSGVLRRLFEKDPAAKRVLEVSAQHLRWSWESICEAAELPPRQKSRVSLQRSLPYWRLIRHADLSALVALHRSGGSLGAGLPRVERVAGDSVGFLAACVSMGSLSLAQAHDVFDAWLEFAIRAKADKPCRRMEVTGCSVDEVRHASSQTGDACVFRIASESEVSVAGSVGALNEMARQLRQQSPSSQFRLPKSPTIPFHCELRHHCVAEDRRLLETLEPSPPSSPLISTRSRGVLLSSAEEVKQECTDLLWQPVDWRNVLVGVRGHASVLIVGRPEAGRLVDNVSRSRSIAWVPLA